MNYLSLYAYYDKEIEEEFTIYNVTYKKEEILNETTLSQHKGLFIFLFENGDLGKKKLIRLKFKNGLSQNIIPDVVGYNQRPITKDRLKYLISHCKPQLKSLKKDDNYEMHEFLIEQADLNKIKYIAVLIQVNKKLDYMSFYIGPES